MPGDSTLPCAICRGEQFDAEFGRVLVWQNHLWRLSTSVVAPVIGFSYLEPRRHIPSIDELDGPEAASFGPTLAAATALLKELTSADLVYALMFGDHVAHLHVNITPHREGDAVRGGAALFDPAALPLPREAHEVFVAQLRSAAAGRLSP
jgi:diadenosine tetraphosphate (Ap4A) HIT family hydrolase